MQEHRDWAAFLDWLPAQQNVNLFSLLRTVDLPRKGHRTSRFQWKPVIFHVFPTFSGAPKLRIRVSARNLEPEVKRRCALTGGAAWVHLGRTTADRARRWTAVA